MKILYMLPSYNLYGGTPKKTLDLMNYFGKSSYVYVYDNLYSEFKPEFIKTSGNIYEGFYGRNIFLHIRLLLKIIDNEGIDVIQTQFTMGEMLGFILKLLRPKVKLIIAFVGPFKPTYFKSILSTIFYRKTDFFVYISQYVKFEKTNQFPILNNKRGKIIFNGTNKRVDNNKHFPLLKSKSLLDIAGLSEWKNIQVLIDAMNVLVNKKNRNDIFLYIAGDGPKRKELELMINNYKISEYVTLLGYQSNVGGLLNQCDVFVHPAYAEGFGIVIPEAMMSNKPIIVSDKGALPELIINKKSGLVVNAHKPSEWVEAILKIIDDKKYSNLLAEQALKRANEYFTVEKYCKNYEELYKNTVEQNMKKS